MHIGITQAYEVVRAHRSEELRLESGEGKTNIYYARHLIP